MIKPTAFVLPLILLSWVLASCGSTEDMDDIDGTFSQALTAEEIDGVLRYVNDCAITHAILDDDAALDVRAATNITQARDGDDGTCNTADDRPFLTIEALDDVPWVGDVALARIVAHAESLGYLQSPDAVYEGVGMTAEEARGILEVVNGASLQMLDDDIGLDSRAVDAIIGARPLSMLQVDPSMNQLVDLPYVGQRAMEDLKAYVPNWSGCAGSASEIEGVEFSSLKAHDTLDFANQAPTTVLAEISGIGPVLADRIDMARPFESLEQLGDVQGIGPALLTNINNELSERWCPLEGARCGCPMGASYRPPFVGFDENGLYYFLAYGIQPWNAERVVDAGFLSHDGNAVVLTDVQVLNDPDEWQDIAELVFAHVWDCCLQHSYFGEPLELGSNRKGQLHIGRIINAHDQKPYVMAYWQDIDDASFGYTFERNSQGEWTLVGQVFLN